MATLTMKDARKNVQTQRAVQKLDPSVKVRSTGITNFGAIAQSSGQGPGVGMSHSITFTLDNSGGAVAKGYRIGDGANWILTAAGLAGVMPDRSSGIPGQAFADAIAQAPMTVMGIGYRATSGAVQFGEPFRYVVAGVDGSTAVKPVNMAEYERNTADDHDLLTLEFQNQFTLDWNRAFYISVAAAQIVNCTLMFGAQRSH